MTFVNFGHMGSNIKNCWIFKIFLLFTFEILQFVSSDSEYRYIFDYNVLLCHASHIFYRSLHTTQKTRHSVTYIQNRIGCSVPCLAKFILVTLIGLMEKPFESSDLKTPFLDPVTRVTSNKSWYLKKYQLCRKYFRIRPCMHSPSAKMGSQLKLRKASLTLVVHLKLEFSSNVTRVTLKWLLYTFTGVVFNASLSVLSPEYPSKELTVLTVLDHL